ncbi:hypothetical protein [Saccharothrix coeruleofusca]|uniref:Uncharacterized protein n=1 Tax=Saccharothrix coeruleofusca TaxID=33919 RepID=A0A918EDK8_9PSEU|nr:hypothetical protein [Saccharothrix coeruleofusca]MBP2336604.1 hypothetical protein [Saccharothrix coeruleofusca]GGP51816.1 hypothetical protein GCM10010185_24840 [Saccharothrix coeruleofusca]
MTATITGEMAVLLGVLGHRQGDSRILDAIALVGPDMEVEEFDFDGEKSTYFTFKQAGTDLLFEDDVLVSVMVRTQPDEQDETYGRYPRPAALVDGLSPTATRAEVTALLGTPEQTGPSFDRYRVNNRYLHFEFDPHDRITKLSALLEPV